MPSSAHQVNDRHRRANNIYSHDQSLVTRSEVFHCRQKMIKPLYKWLLTLFTCHNFYNWVSTAPSSSAPRPPLCVDPPEKNLKKTKFEEKNTKKYYKHACKHLNASAASPRWTNWFCRTTCRPLSGNLAHCCKRSTRHQRESRNAFGNIFLMAVV